MDIQEYSIEMQLPFIRKIFEGRSVRVLPLGVSRKYSKSSLKRITKELAPLAADPHTLVVVSTNLLDWKCQLSSLQKEKAVRILAESNYGTSSLSSLNKTNPSFVAIAQYRRALQGACMRAISYGEPDDLVNNAEANAAHAAFSRNLERNGSRMCGAGGVQLLLTIMTYMRVVGSETVCRFTGYKEVKNALPAQEHTASYASAYVRIKET